MWHHCRQVFPKLLSDTVTTFAIFSPGCSFSIACCLSHPVRVASTLAVGRWRNLPCDRYYSLYVVHLRTVVFVQPGPIVGAAGEAPTPTQPGKIHHLVAELDRLRARVAEMEIEREEVRKKRSRSLSVPSPNLVGGPDVSLQGLGAQQRVGLHQGAFMETLISTLAQSNRFSPLA